MAAPRSPTGPQDRAPGRRPGLTRGITRNVVALGLVSLLTDVSSEMLVYVIPLFLANVVAATPAIIGIIEGIAESVAAILKLLSGAISDRFGRRRLLVGTGYGTSVASKVIYLAAASWPMVLAARVGDRIGKGIRTAPRDALIADSTAAGSRGLAFGFHRAMDTSGAILGVAIAASVVALAQGDATLLSNRTFHDLVLVALVPGALAVVVVFVGVRDTRPARRERRPEAQPAGPATEATPPTAPDGTATGAPRGNRGLPPAFWLFVVASAVFTLGNSSDAFLALRSQQLGMTVRDLLLVVIAFNVVNAAIAWPVGGLSDRVGRRGLIALAWTIYALAYAGFAISGTSGNVPVLWLVYGAFYGINDAVGRALVADVAPFELRATAFAVLNAVVGVTLLPASIVAGLLWDGAGPASPFWFGAGCAAVATVFLVAFVRPPGAPHRESVATAG